MPSPGFLETVYGVLFDPVATFRRMREAPPLGLTAGVVTVVNSATALMSILTFRMLPADPSGFGTALGGLAPFIALIGFFFWYLKWLGYGAVLHLTAQLLNGEGGPKATLVAYGLTGLPSLLLLPLQGLMAVLRPGGLAESLITALFGLAVLVWSTVLLVLALREMHNLTTGRAVAVVAVPAAVLLLAVGFTMVISLLGLIAFLPEIPVQI
ncbi:MAG: Yip1 family protein [Thermoanaerobacterales bacterium]|nr:Yip1 family protein [Bacillota bacterium]MDI6907504.1 Yip1 family protein [Thermoanaerobacterales bacterium]